MDKSRKKIVIASILLAVVVVILFIVIAVNSIFKNNQAPSKKLNELSDKFYGYFYQDLLDEYKNEDSIEKYLSTFKDSGLYINLDSLKIYLDARKIEKYDAFKSCNSSTTGVTIYPVSPYKADDYKVKLTLDCK